MNVLRRALRSLFGKPYVLIRRSQELEWDDRRDSPALRSFLQSFTGQKLLVCMRDTVICDAEDGKPRDHYLGKLELISYIISLQGDPSIAADLERMEEHGEDKLSFPTLPDDDISYLDGGDQLTTMQQEPDEI